MNKIKIIGKSGSLYLKMLKLLNDPIQTNAAFSLNLQFHSHLFIYISCDNQLCLSSIKIWKIFFPKCVVSLTSLKSFTILAAVYFWTFSPIFNSVYHLDPDFVPWTLLFPSLFLINILMSYSLHPSSVVDC